MLNTAKLRGIIAERGLSQAKVARAIGITPRGFCNKMKRAAFTCNELEKLVELLEIAEPWETLFRGNKKNGHVGT